MGKNKDIKRMIDNMNKNESIDNNNIENNYDHLQKTLEIEKTNIIKPIINDPNDEYLIFECPNCNLQIQVYKNEINCCVFRHGIYKNTYQQIPPHLSKIECDELLKNNKIYGCCIPFYFCKNKIINESTIIICDYI